jgi:hypothetical protein
MVTENLIDVENLEFIEIEPATITPLGATNDKLCTVTDEPKSGRLDCEIQSGDQSCFRPERHPVIHPAADCLRFLEAESDHQLVKPMIVQCFFFTLSTKVLHASRSGSLNIKKNSSRTV